MKNTIILFLACLLLSGVASAQLYGPDTKFGTEHNRSNSLFALGIPRDTFAIPTAKQAYPHIAAKGDTIYIWNTSTLAWQEYSSGESMVYPSSGIALSNGTGWETSIIDNSADWNTAYGWGNHASAGYVPGARTITINGVTYDLTNDRTWSVGTVTQAQLDDTAAAKQRKINYTDSSFKLTNDSLLFRDYVNIKSLGAVGDGSTDNLAVFNAAVATGKNIFVPEGNFRVSAFFTLGDDQSIFGLGSKSIISTTANNRIMYIGDRCLVSGLHFKGSGKSAGLPFQTGIVLYDAVGWVVDRCIFADFSGTAQQNGGGGTYAASLASSNSDGGIISNCYYKNNNGAAVFAQRGEYVTLTGNVMGGNTVGVGMGAGNLTVTGNNIHNNTTGIKSFAGTNDGHSTVTGNLINHNTFPLDINDVAYNVGNSFSNNMIYFGAIKITNSNNIRFQGGTISNLDSIHLNNSRFTRFVNVNVGPYYLGGDIPINKYNNSDDIEILGGVRRDSATATPYIKMIREDSIFFKLPTETKKAFFLMMDAYGHLVKVDSTGIGGSGGGGDVTFSNSGTFIEKIYNVKQPTAITATSTTTVDLATGNMFHIDLDVNITTFTFNNPATGTYIIKLKQDGTGTKTVAFPGGWLWSGGTVPTVTSTANKTDVLTLVYDGTSYYASILQNF